MSVTTVDGGSRANHGQAASTARRTELAAFLRSRRERISPEDVGLPVGTRRRTAGLRREELAQLAGVGVTWYTWLEQGRPINASVQVLDAIARTLRLDTIERAHLFRLADVPGAAGPADCVECPLPPEVQRILDAMPFPASVATERFDLLAWNKMYAALFPRVTQAPAGERNTLLSCLTGPACCSPLPEQDKYSAMLIAQLRAAYGRHVGDPAWTHFIRRLEAPEPAVRRDLGRPRRGHAEQPHQALPAPHLRDDHHQVDQLRGRRRPGGADGDLHPRGRAKRASRRPAGRGRGADRPLPLLQYP